MVHCCSRAREISGSIWDSSLNGPDVKLRELASLICSPIWGVPGLEADTDSCRVQCQLQKRELSKPSAVLGRTQLAAKGKRLHDNLREEPSSAQPHLLQ